LKNLNIITNERIFYYKNNFFSENIDCSSIVDGLSKNFTIKVFARSSCKFEKNLISKKKNIYLSKNIFTFLKNIILSGNLNNSYNLVLSITPYTFLAFFFINFFSKKKIYVYLRSDGFKEYEIILGKSFILLYKLMYDYIMSRAIIIACEKSLSLNRSFHLVFPSEISKEWLLKKKKVSNIKLFKFLYVGRIKIEKGIYYLIDLFNNLENDKYSLSIVGQGNINLFLNSNIKILDYVSGFRDLIKIYDAHNIFVLPSYTEAHPKVIDEALSRLLPVIIFEDIKHVVGSRKGVFVCKRNLDHFITTSEYILNNYSDIINEIKNNILPTKEKFIDNLSNIIFSEE
jgi:glycosyltransferase involved in cell wall biosynthesis